MLKATPHSAVNKDKHGPFLYLLHTNPIPLTLRDKGKKTFLGYLVIPHQMQSYKPCRTQLQWRFKNDVLNNSLNLEVSVMAFTFTLL